MTSADETAEDRIVSAAFPVIKLLCLGRWYNLEYDDRCAEAMLLFIELLRSKPLTSGHFVRDYLSLLPEHMDKLNRRTPSLRFGRFSLDAPIAGAEEDGVNGHGILHAYLSDFSRLSACEFLSSLTEAQRRIVLLRMCGYGMGMKSTVENVALAAQGVGCSCARGFPVGHKLLGGVKCPLVDDLQSGDRLGFHIAVVDDPYIHSVLQNLDERRIGKIPSVGPCNAVFRSGYYAPHSAIL